MNRCILFDFADTLAELHPRREDIVADYIAARSASVIGPEAIRHAQRRLDALLPYSSVHITTPAQRRAFYDDYNRRLFDALGISHLVDPAGLEATFRNRDTHWSMKAGARELLTSLKREGYGVGIISNFDGRLEGLVQRELGLAGLVDYLHVSGLEGVEKPDTRFYQGFFARHGVDPRRSCLIGDSYTLDFLPAWRIGLMAVLLDEIDHYPWVFPRIRRLDQFPAVLAEHVRPVLCA